MKIICTFLTILTATVSVHALPAVRVTTAGDALEAPSFVPAEERFVHIAGGFFSYFDRKTGTLVDTSGRTVGCVRIALDGLHRQSLFVYLPEGSLTLHDTTGDMQSFSLQQLDYVQLPDSEVPAYRLTGEGATLIATETGDPVPSLIGNLFVETEDGFDCFAVTVRGRSENEAERHLWRVIERATVY